MERTLSHLLIAVLSHLTVALVLLASGPDRAAAEDYVDNAARYRVTLPPSWTKSTDEDGSLVYQSPRINETFGMCFVDAKDMPDTQSMSQAEIDSHLSGQFDRAFWLDLFKEADMKDATLEESGERVQRGRTTYFAVATYSEESLRVRFKTVAHLIPGRAFNIYCAATVDGYARETVDFESFFDAFTPLDSGLVAQAPFARVSAPRTLGAAALRPSARQAGKTLRALLEKRRKTSRR